ncbi:hypothetical protein P692DRAFT_20318319 [Suillus brevipes Sb2]|nr:hypothetical protein P692DRAFT_20318319 [Suillus brevipes Sb2]
MPRGCCSFVLYNLSGPQSDMSSFVPGHFGDYPPSLGEGPSHVERPQDPGQTSIVIIEMPQVVHIILATLSLLCCFISRQTPCQTHSMIPSKPWVRSQATQNNPRTQERHITGVQQVVITVKTDCAEFQTSFKPVHVDQTVVEWNEPILLPCEPSFIVRVSMYALFELDPMFRDRSFAHSRSLSENCCITAKIHIP